MLEHIKFHFIPHFTISQSSIEIKWVFGVRSRTSHTFVSFSIVSNVSIKSARTQLHRHIHGMGTRENCRRASANNVSFHFQCQNDVLYFQRYNKCTIHIHCECVCARVYEFASVFVAPYLKRYSCLDKFMHERRCYPFFFVFIIDARFDSVAVAVAAAAAAATTHYFSLTCS